MRVLRSKERDFPQRFQEILERRRQALEAAEEVVKPILRAVREEGDQALCRLSEELDGVRLEPSELEIKRDLWEEAWESLDEGMKEALETAASNISSFHQREIERSWVDSSRGRIRGQLIRTAERAGVYVPGGKATYPSSLLMGVIPARVAGVKEVVVVTPPSPEGVNPLVLAAAKVSGADRLFQIGGAQGIAALAYGTDTVPKVEVIVGPGNIYVAAAKRLLFGEVKVEGIAGPSEIMILSDGSTSPRHVAADLLSQAEHDEEAWAVLVSTDEEFAREVEDEIAKLLPSSPRREIIERSLEQHGLIILVRDIGEGMEVANRFAPEHLELAVEDPFALLGEVRAAGAVFLGGNSPEALGDYIAGPNHILPTGGAARSFSPLGVEVFCKRTSFIAYTASALREVAPQVIRLAEAEGLFAHAEAVRVRLEGGEDEGGEGKEKD